MPKKIARLNQNDAVGNSGPENTIQEQEKVDKDIEYFRELYSVSEEPFVCKLHRVHKNDFGNEKYTFLNDFTHVPTEKDIAVNYGGGDYSLMFYRREGPRGGLKIKEKVRFSVDNIWDKDSDLDNKDVTTIKPESDNGINHFLEQARLYKELLSGNGNGSAEQGVFQMMMQMQTSLMTVMIELVKSSGKSDNKLLETILPTLLSKSLEKQNVVNDIENIAKLKEIFPGEGGTDWGSALLQALPLLFQMSNQSSSVKPPSAFPRHVPASGIDPVALKKVVKESIMEIQDELAAEDEQTDDQPEDTDPSLELVENSNDQDPEIKKQMDANMNVKAQVNMIRKAPRSAQNEVLKMWLNMKPPKEVMAFCIDTELVKDKDEFLSRCKEIGLPELEKELQ